jgi:MFS family permease
MSFYLVAAFGGPIIGPLSGSFLAAATTYKWIFWLLTIFSGVSLVAGAFVRVEDKYHDSLTGCSVF